MDLTAVISISTSTLALISAIGVAIAKVAKLIKKVNERNELLTEIPGRLESMEGSLAGITESNRTQTERLDRIETEVNGNEKDRLKHVIFEYGNQCRRGCRLSGEEFRYLQQVFEKYTAKGGNDIAHDEYEFIKDVYNCVNDKKGE